MSGLNDIFGPHPDRPDHPDFWKLSDAVLKLDGRLEAAAPEDRHQVFQDTVNEYVDLECLSYMATQRATRAMGDRFSIEMLFKLSALFMDAFIMGCEYERNSTRKSSG